MKNLISFTILFFAVICIFSCKPCPECPDCPEAELTLTTKDTISQQKFTTWRQNWNMYGKSYTQGTLTRYFTMPLVDITEFDNNRSSAVVASRFHLGMEINGTDSIPHLMLVGVNANGDDVIDFSNDQFIYDVTTPCPTSCGVSSLPK